jgi:cytidylate kinase
VNASRFLSHYGVDKTRLRNYDVVCDTTSATPEQVVARIIEALETSTGTAPAPLCHLDPSRVGLR